jgi:hypothetical protein
MAEHNDMNEPDALQVALDGALRRALLPPALPADFTQRLSAALARLPADERAQQRRALEQERAEQLAQLQRDSVRLRLNTLGALIGGAFVAGVGTALAWPWINATFAPHGSLALGLIGAGVGLAIGLSGWLRTGAVRPDA